MTLRRIAPALLLAAIACSKDVNVVFPETVTGENMHSGEPGWLKEIYQIPAFQAYADRVSTAPGTSINIMAQTDTTQEVQWILYRLGWYGGAGARRVASGVGSVTPQSACTMDAPTQLVRCPWSPSFRVSVPSGIISGLFAIKIIRGDGNVAMVPVVVEDDRPTPLLVQASVTTWQAYNAFQGESFYEDRSHTSPSGLATAISFERPYADNYGLGQLLRYEYPLVRFLERVGYDVSYTTNLDVARVGAPLLLPHRAFISGAHDEYWPLAERVAIEHALDAGVSVIFLGANEAYWKIRLSELGVDGNARVLSCYKYQTDPDQGPETTGRWRDPPINWPEAKLAGQQFLSLLFLSFPLVVTDPQHFLFAGTGLTAGDVLPLVVRQEFDAPADTSPPDLHVAARSPVIDEYGNVLTATAASYRVASGALVFSSGSIGWVDELDGSARDPRVERMTGNVVQAATGIEIPAEVGVGDPPAPPLRIGPFARSVTTVVRGLGEPSSIAAMHDGSLVVGTKTQILRVGPSPDRAVEPYANLAAPLALTAAPDGTVYVARGNAIYAIAAAPPHTIRLLAGSDSQPGIIDAVGTAARFNSPMGVSFDGNLRALLVADTRNNAIRLVDPVSGKTSTLFSNFGAAYPTGVVRAEDGRFFVDATASGQLETLESGGSWILARRQLQFSDGTSDRAGVSSQGGLLWDGTQLYVADPAAGRIRRIIPGADASSTRVSTLAGGSGRGLVDGDGAEAQFSLPTALTLGLEGTIYIADAGADAIRAIERGRKPEAQIPRR